MRGQYCCHLGPCEELLASLADPLEAVHWHAVAVLELGGGHQTTRTADIVPAHTAVIATWVIVASEYIT